MTEFSPDAQSDPASDESGNDEPDFSGRVAEFLLVATPFLLLALFLFIEWWVRS